MKVGALADEKRAYYRELLDMRRTEHQHKLEVLELKLDLSAGFFSNCCC